MKKISRFFIILVVLVVSGCQTSGQKGTAEISRKDRLVGFENIGLRKELSGCRAELEEQKKLLEKCQKENEELAQRADKSVIGFAPRQKKLVEQCREEKEKILDKSSRDFKREQGKLLEQCRKEKEKIYKETGESTKFIMEDLPNDLLKQAEQLTNENEQLKARIAELEKVLIDANAVPADANEAKIKE